jgi:hypothetical protein
MLLTMNHQLMGPQHGGFTARQPASWQHPDTANSSSIKYFGFRDGVPDLAWAAWYLMWRPNPNGTSKARLIAMDTGGPGYGSWRELAVFTTGAGWGPTPQGVTIGEHWYAMAQKRIDQYVGFQVWGDGLSESQIWESRLMVEFSISATFLAKRMIGITPKTKFLNHKPRVNFEALERLPKAK